jgi:hypothetical protein
VRWDFVDGTLDCAFSLYCCIDGPGRVVGSALELAGLVLLAPVLLHWHCVEISRRGNGFAFFSSLGYSCLHLHVSTLFLRIMTCGLSAWLRMHPVSYGFCTLPLCAYSYLLLALSQADEAQLGGMVSLGTSHQPGPHSLTTVRYYVLTNTNNIPTSN